MKKISSEKISQLSHSLSSIDLQEMLLSRAKNAVLETVIYLLEQDMENLCGKGFSRKGGELCHRGGSELTSLMLDGAKHSFRRPRARKNGKEVELPVLSKIRDQDLLDSQVLSRLVSGVSTRKYEGVIGQLSERTGVSKSSVSRAFKRASKKHLDEINGSDLSSYKFIALLIDGTGLGESTQVVAVGVTTDGQKIPLGLKEGDTENKSVVTDLLTNIQGRGFAFGAAKLLCVLDGGKALRAAVKSLWGNAAIIQRCWIHKLRNIKDYIPEVNHGQLWKRMKRMMGLRSHKEALREYKLLKDWLSTISHDAEKSLDEAGSELLTVIDLGLTGDFRNSLSSTNLIESLIGIVKSHTRRVKNWDYHPRMKEKNPRDKALRWMATAIQEHHPKMRKLKGSTEQMETLIKNLNNIDSQRKTA